MSATQDPYQSYLEQMLAVANEKRRALKSILENVGVTIVRAEYDRSGDSGQISEKKFDGATAATLAAVGIVQIASDKIAHFQQPSSGIQNAVEDMFYEFLEYRQPGWEIDEGSSGEFE